MCKVIFELHDYCKKTIDWNAEYCQNSDSIKPCANFSTTPFNEKYFKKYKRVNCKVCKQLQKHEKEFSDLTKFIVIALKVLK